MKIKKEYLAVGAALAVIAVIAVAIVLRGRGSDIPDSVDVNPDNVTDDSLVSGEDVQVGDTDVLPGDEQQETDETSHDNEVFEWGDLSIPSQDVTDEQIGEEEQPMESEFPVVDPGTPEDVPSGEITANDLDTEGDTGDAGNDYETMSLEDYAFMMRYFVCGLDTDMYDRWLTDSVRARFGIWDEEPYIALHNNKTFGQVVYDESSFSFMAGDGVVYKFAWTFENGRVSSIIPM